jgi:steroid delta-isomerase-like uncharacterized protein
MSTEENIRLDDAMRAAWNSHDVGEFLAICDDNIIWRDVASPEPYRGKEGARQFMKGWMTAMPDLNYREKNRLVTEDAVAVEFEFSGTNSGPIQIAPGAPAIPATGKKVNAAKGTYFGRIRGGKWVEFSSYPDIAGLMMQLGLMPGPK